MLYKKIFLLGGLLFFSTGITLHAAAGDNLASCEAPAPRRRVGMSPVMRELGEALIALPRPFSEDNPIGMPCADFDKVMFKLVKIDDEAEQDRLAAEWLVKVKAKHAEIELENAAYEKRKQERERRQKAEAAATKKSSEEEYARKVAEQRDTADRMARSNGYSSFDAMQKEIERSPFSGSSTSASAGSGWQQGPSTRFGRSGNAGSNKNAPFLTPLRVSWIAAFIGAQIARFSLYVEIEKEILEENRRNDITMTPQEIAVEIQREIEGKRSEHYKRRNAQRIETALNIIGIMGFFADLFTGLA